MYCQPFLTLQSTTVLYYTYNFVPGDKLRNPFRVVNSGNERFDTSDSFTIPKTPEKPSAPRHDDSSIDKQEISQDASGDENEEFVIPSTPERDEDMQHL